LVIELITTEGKGVLHGATNDEFWSLHGMGAGFRSEACGLFAGTSGVQEFSRVE
jgi:hypothetical protein